MIFRSLIPLIALTILCALPLKAHAQETSGNFGGGSVKIGNDNRACSGALEGTIRYTASDVIEVCDGTSWASPAAPTPCTIGAAVGDGICAGVWQGQNLIAALAGCNDGDTIAANCDGTDDTEEWGSNGWGDLDNSYVDMVQANADWATEYGSTPTNRAPGSCAGLGLDGETWYIPTMPQLLIMYNNKDTGSWTNGGFSNDQYYSINTRYADTVDTIDFTDGEIQTANSQFGTESFRCVRLTPF